MSEPQYIIVAPKQYDEGYMRVDDDGFVVKHQYRMVRGLEDGRYMVVNPRAAKPPAK